MKSHDVGELQLRGSAANWRIQWSYKVSSQALTNHFHLLSIRQFAYLLIDAQKFPATEKTCFISPPAFFFFFFFASALATAAPGGVTFSGDISGTPGGSFGAAGTNVPRGLKDEVITIWWSKINVTF